ncbi:MAG: carboxylating nicotinate-nucleotide diphosphorylase [Flavobacteriales bacterium]|nr:carboxylating nicotinate-nucleotide diphosphorylase [Flavobacteriales bacterium]MBK7940369.1 carboxylating nicotinate-nucleotide diphosphorylase [Flavobacteriales bacterium]MBK8950091.1 carboxylating nicotinate-nucleotide diphosphorylase [Flavobacteriales bacterium]MBK9699471.1 carboxylating nicotinate-nucleotide diphosphorylase [Flavobacteriales bacterium]
MTVLPPGTETLITAALAEDIGDGDHTTRSTIPPGARGGMRLLVKQDGVLAGVDLARAICAQAHPDLHMRPLLEDGAHVKAGDVAFTLTGPVQALLTTERVLLNFMQRLSGIATLTRRFVDALDGTGCRVLDTRKTTPTLRALEKWAVRIGGGENHRFGLYDMILIKDNHVDFAGGVGRAIEAARDHVKALALDIPIEVEARTLREVEEILAHGGADRIMLDNFGHDDLRRAVALIGRRHRTEASGGITLANARATAECGVDFISVGALTHSATSLDLSLKAL